MQTVANFDVHLPSMQPKGHVPQAQLSPTSDEYILDLLGTCEQKLLKLMDDLGGRDISDVMKEMEDMEVRWRRGGNSICYK